MAMRSSGLRKLARLASLFLLLQGVGAGQNTTLISLDQAIDLALAHNHAIKATRTLILQNQAQEITANLRPNPTFGADSQFIPIFTPQDFSVDELNLTQQFDIGISYLFERGHKRQRRLQAARDQTAVTRPGGRRGAAWPSTWHGIRQRAAGGIYLAVRAGIEGFSGTVDIAQAQYSAGAISEAEDQAAAAAVSDRRILGPSGQGQALIASCWVTMRAGQLRW
jgi:cobalt-zinc-cadmium efflux system outer membrane protein